MNRDKNGRFTKVSKELAIGDKITSFDQLKEGMIIDFRADIVNVKNAILVFDNVYNEWYAVHNNPKADGCIPSAKVHTYGKKYGWALGEVGEKFGTEDFTDMIFRGWYKKEEKVKTPEVKEEVKPEVKEEVKSEVKNPFKIGDFVCHISSSRIKYEVIGIHGNLVWYKECNLDGVYMNSTIKHLVPWVEPIKLKYKKGDLVVVNSLVEVLWEIHEVTDKGYVMKNIVKGDIMSNTYTDSDILRKIGVSR